MYSTLRCVWGGENQRRIGQGHHSLKSSGFGKAVRRETSYHHDQILKGFNGGILQDFQLTTEDLHRPDCIGENCLPVALPFTLGILPTESNLKVLPQRALSTIPGSFESQEEEEEEESQGDGWENELV